MIKPKQIRLRNPIRTTTPDRTPLSGSKSNMSISKWPSVQDAIPVLKIQPSERLQENLQSKKKISRTSLALMAGRALITSQQAAKLLSLFDALNGLIKNTTVDTLTNHAIRTTQLIVQTHAHACIILSLLLREQAPRSECASDPFGSSLGGQKCTQEHARVPQSGLLGRRDT